jgi:phosphoglucomutase
MGTQMSPLAGKPASSAPLVDVEQLVDTYYSVKPDWQLPSQRVALGTSGHRGSSRAGSFNEDHILAISQTVAAGRRFAARTAGTENIYKIHADSFRDRHHLQQMLDEAQTIVDTAIEGK